MNKKIMYRYCLIPLLTVTACIAQAEQNQPFALAETDGSTTTVTQSVNLTSTGDEDDPPTDANQASGGSPAVKGASTSAQIAVPFTRSGSLQLDINHSELTHGYRPWNGIALTGVWKTDPKNVWHGEVVRQNEFGDHGVYTSVGNTHTVNEDYYTYLSAGASSGGIFLPHYRADAQISKKWLKDKNLVTTLGVAFIKEIDVHRDTQYLLSAQYYFKIPLVIEAGFFFNHSNPGAVNSRRQYLVAQYGTDKQQYLTLRHEWGKEAYQLISTETALTDFNSHITSIDWRKWISKSTGFRVLGEHYVNPEYVRNGVTFGVFKEF